MLHFHSDDFGHNPTGDKKISELIENNQLIGVSVISNTISPNSLKDLINLVRKRDFYISLHINLIEGKSISPKEKINSLVNQQSKFYPSVILIIKLLFGLINPSHLRLEINKQLEFLKNHGLTIKAIDSHQHLHALSPIAEIIMEEASKNNLKNIRSYGQVKTFTPPARFKYLLLKIIAFLSYLRYHGHFGLPPTWYLKSTNPLVIMSWEGKNFNWKKDLDENLIYIIHPYLGFDKNTDYYKLLIASSAKHS